MPYLIVAFWQRSKTERTSEATLGVGCHGVEYTKLIIRIRDWRSL